MRFKEGMTAKQKIEAVQRMILVHSMLYYEMNESIISDKRFDKISSLLCEKQSELSLRKLLSTQYGYVFQDFDGTTGFDLISRLTQKDRTRIEQIANHVLRSYKLEKNIEVHL